MRYFTLFCITLMLAAGCTSVEKRIEQSPEFGTWSPEVQQTVRRGEVRLGFSGDMTRVALGEPDRIIRREAREGVSQLWVYQTHVPVPIEPHGPFFGWFEVGHYHGGSFGHYYPPYVYEARDVLRLTFDAAGELSKIERIEER
ncbi:MAG: hypothetical protein AAF493_28665 [Pseudomonadota bacterium]